MVIKDIKKNKDKTYSIQAVGDDIWYDYKSLKLLQEMIVKASKQKGLL
jgi:hypothetical protein